MPFTAKLLNLPPWVFFFLINLSLICLSLTLLYLVRRFLPNHERRIHNDVVSGIFNRAGAMYAVMLAFTVVLLWQQYHKIADNALKEGNAASSLYRDLILYPDKSQTEMAVISHLNFIHSVVKEEYPAMMEMKSSMETQHLMEDLWTKIVRIQPGNQQEQALYNKMLRDFETLSELRNLRLIDMDSSLPNVLWLSIISGTIVTIFFSVFLGAERLWIHAVATSILAIIIATNIFLIIELDYPFIGELSVRPVTYIKILELK